MSAPYASILETIGNTPIVRINNLGPKHVEIYAKIEAFNPMGSVKDRLAIGVIEAAEQAGTLKPGQTVVEATSGNTGIGLAMVCAQKGYPLVIVMAESFSVERRRMMRFLGAKVILTPASEKGTGMINKARELAEANGWFLTRQFEAEANADIHSRTTAVEILDTFKDAPLDYWITGFGTGGTLKGVSRVLKAQSPQTKIIVAEPDNAQLLGSHIAQPRNPDGSAAASHPAFRPHLMQGWSPDFISKLANDATEAGLVDAFQPVAGLATLECTKDLAAKEGIFCGITGGATFAAALKIAEKAPEGSRILVMLPDTGERYLSTPLFEDIGEDMDAEEVSISQSTPNYRFDVPSAPAPASTAAVVAPTQKAVDFVSAAISDPDNPVVLFALEWCEFCWSVRRLFAATGITYRSIDLDSVDYQANDWGGDIRAALREVAKAPTIPQIFVGGKHIGGATETFDAFNSGAMQEMLKANSVAFDQAGISNAYSFLPKWLQTR